MTTVLFWFEEPATVGSELFIAARHRLKSTLSITSWVSDRYVAVHHRHCHVVGCADSVQQGRKRMHHVGLVEAGS